MMDQAVIEALRGDRDSAAPKLVIHCLTEEDANELLAVAESYGWRWVDGEQLTENNNWNKYKEKTCYCLNYFRGGFQFGNQDFYLERCTEKIEYVEFSSIDYEPATPDELLSFLSI